MLVTLILWRKHRQEKEFLLDASKYFGSEGKPDVTKFMLISSSQIIGKI
jgi:hypothetical protein